MSREKLKSVAGRVLDRVTDLAQEKRPEESIGDELM
jgi:hypothetical protein